MNDLVTFLKARLDEDEETALAAGNRRWLVQDNTVELYPEQDDDGYMRWPTRADARHAANWEPARVLREIEAKRRILTEHSILTAWRVCTRCSYYADPGELFRRVPGPCATVRLLALPYADHPDYQESWKP